MEGIAMRTRWCLLIAVAAASTALVIERARESLRDLRPASTGPAAPPLAEALAALGAQFESLAITLAAELRAEKGRLQRELAAFCRTRGSEPPPGGGARLEAGRAMEASIRRLESLSRRKEHAELHLRELMALRGAAAGAPEDAARRELTLLEATRCAQSPERCPRISTRHRLDPGPAQRDRDAGPEALIDDANAWLEGRAR
jgi:hypothetical protein